MTVPRVFAATLLCIVLSGAQTHTATADSPAESAGLHNPSPRSQRVTEPPDTDLRQPPTGDEIVCPGEYCRADGVFLAYETAYGSTQILVDIAYEVAQADTVYMVVKNSTARTQAYNQLSAAGVNMDHVQFIIYSQLSDNCIWVRDYGPEYTYEDGAKAIVDFWYPFTSDDYLPIAIGAEFGLPVYTSDLLHSGGNFMTDGNGMGFCTEIAYTHNPGYTHAQVRQIFRDYCGLDSMLVLPVLDVENTKHIDVFCKLLDDDTFIVGEYESPASGAGNNYYILNDIAAYLEDAHNLAGREFTVMRIPMPDYEPGPWVGVTRTYTNSLIINGKVLMPVYGLDTDAEAMAVYQSILPDYEIIGIDSEDIIQRAGAVHCITKLHHSDNPLIITHTPLVSLPGGSAPTIEYRVNPGFADSEALVFYRDAAEEEFTEVPATLTMGIWSATLPVMVEDFHYYLAGTCVSGASQFDVVLPASAPEDFFVVEVTGSSDVAAEHAAQLRLVGAPNPFSGRASICFTVPVGETARLEILNPVGRLVRSYAPFGAGDHAVLWTEPGVGSTGHESGVYLCRLTSGRQIESIKLLRLR